MYLIRNVTQDIDLGKTQNIAYVFKDTNTDSIIPSIDIFGNGIYYKGNYYNIDGRIPMGDYDIVQIIELDNTDFLIDISAIEERYASYVDYLSAMTGIDLPDEEEEELEEE